MWRSEVLVPLAAMMMMMGPTLLVAAGGGGRGNDYDRRRRKHASIRKGRRVRLSLVCKVRIRVLTRDVNRVPCSPVRASNEEISKGQHVRPSIRTRPGCGPGDHSNHRAWSENDLRSTEPIA